MSFTTVTIEKALLLIRVTCMYIYFFHGATVPGGPGPLQHSQETSLPPAGFEPEIPVSDRPQTYALSRATTGFGT
jgi:hypothetical protein